MSPVVQHLEQAAIAEPYRSQTTSSTQSIPGVPTSVRSTDSSGSVTAAALSTPGAYNPVAPQAPEPIAHREKTPPPPEAVTGTGLMAAAVLEHPTQVQCASGQAVSQQALYMATPRTGYFSGPPQSAMSVSFSPPPPSGLDSPDFPPPPPPGGSPHPAQQNFRQSIMAQQPQHQDVQQQQNDQQTPLQSPGLQQAPMQTPGLQQSSGQQSTPMHSPSLFGPQVMQSPGLPPPPPYGPSNVQTAAHAAPPGGFSNYTYTSQLPPQQVYGDPAATHSQLYRPTEAEAAHGVGHSAPAKPSRLDRHFDRFGNLEKGVNKWLKKLDQKI